MGANASSPASAAKPEAKMSLFGQAYPASGSSPPGASTDSLERRLATLEEAVKGMCSKAQRANAAASLGPSGSPANARGASSGLNAGHKDGAVNGANAAPIRDRDRDRSNSNSNSNSRTSNSPNINTNSPGDDTRKNVRSSNSGPAPPPFYSQQQQQQQLPSSYNNDGRPPWRQGWAGGGPDKKARKKKRKPTKAKP